MISKVAIFILKLISSGFINKKKLCSLKNWIFFFCFSRALKCIQETMLPCSCVGLMVMDQFLSVKLFRLEGDDSLSSFCAVGPLSVSVLAVNQQI